jgi:hypothetical protein
MYNESSLRVRFPSWRAARSLHGGASPQVSSGQPGVQVQEGRPLGREVRGVRTCRSARKPGFPGNVRPLVARSGKVS